MTTDLAFTLDQIADKVRTHLHRGVNDFLEAGRWLTEAKRKCEHGAWGPWLQREFSLSHRMAQHLMNAFEKFSGKSETISDLRMSVVFLLAAPNTPQGVVDDVIADAKAGKPVTTGTVKKQIMKAKTKPAVTTTGTAEAKPTPPITITATLPDDRETARQYAEDLKAKRAAAEAPQPKPARDANPIDDNLMRLSEAEADLVCVLRHNEEPLSLAIVRGTEPRRWVVTLGQQCGTGATLDEAWHAVLHEPEDRPEVGRLEERDASPVEAAP
ncbi:DUF3102 domain-containing protein [Bradyrhizobium sp. SZCCHNRI2010]|uniref:DUF3102 domain-containing protein n=1 Tax=Bradyrhizobium sp. SZCCHNRI2010 TaxID=3057283 RepID=UPI0028E18996|nr:DUF3102 domain-containing protein [Bradyrhizobium sp. SZCCHNRI2010]